MANGQLNWIANFIWGIADDVLRDVYVRGKYRVKEAKKGRAKITHQILFIYLQNHI